jgi:very-short-patch-repair endonuclease
MSHEIVLARDSRRLPTNAEQKLWSRLRRHGIGWHFRRQHLVPPFVLDFACPGLMVAMEANGGQHNEPGDHGGRDDVLRKQGWFVLRFWNNEILANTEGVITTIQAACQQRAGSKTPSPTLPELRAGEGVN